MRKLFGNDFVIPGYRRIKQTDIAALTEHYSGLDKCLYLHSPSGAFSYYDTGNYSLWYKDGGDALIVRKFKNNPHYFIIAPNYNFEEIDKLYTELSRKTHTTPIIAEVDEKFMTGFMESTTGYGRTKVGDEFLYDAELNVKCEGSQYRDMRYRFKKFHNLYPNLELRKATEDDVPGLMDMLTEWNETQGKKYFRSTIGRDKRFLSMFIGKESMLCNVLIDEGKIIGYCTMETAYKPGYGILVSAKALPEYKEAGYTLWHESFRDAVDMGIKYVNAAASYGKGVKEQKMRWRPVEIINTYNISRKG